MMAPSRYLFHAALGACLLVLVVIAPSTRAEKKPAPPGISAAPSDAVVMTRIAAPDFSPQRHVIAVPHDEPFLPDLPGRDAFVSNCVICHSPRYVTNQPRFPRKTWNAEVKKMVSMYGAPVPADQVQAITDYLVRFNGVADPAPRAAGR